MCDECARVLAAVVLGAAKERLGKGKVYNEEEGEDDEAGEDYGRSSDDGDELKLSP